MQNALGTMPQLLNPPDNLITTFETRSRPKKREFILSIISDIQPQSENIDICLDSWRERLHPQNFYHRTMI